MNIRVKDNQTVLTLTVTERRKLIDARSVLWAVNKHAETKLAGAAATAHKDIEAVLVLIDETADDPVDTL